MNLDQATLSAVWEVLKAVNWLEWAKAVFDLLKGIAWPLAVFSLVWIFKSELRERIKDLISVGPTGAVLQPPVQQTSIKASTGLIEQKHPMLTVQNLIEVINKQVDDLPSEEKLPKLIFSLAEAQVERDFENIWSIILGSQITLLRYLLGVGQVTMSDITEYFEKSVKGSPGKEILADWSAENWMGWLFTEHLLRLDGTNVSITQRGKDFLLFVDVKKKDQVRAG